MTERAPRDGQHVLGWVSDQQVGVEDEPAIIWMVDGHWWSGLPGGYVNLENEGWTVTRWQPLADGEEARKTEETP